MRREFVAADLGSLRGAALAMTVPARKGRLPRNRSAPSNVRGGGQQSKARGEVGWVPTSRGDRRRQAQF
jgi:hypothetical protein